MGTKSKAATERLRHCKIVGTLGPASSSEETIRELILSGLDIARVNFSHGDHDSHLKLIDRVRRVSKDLGRPVSILQDLQGPKIRCGQLEGGQMKIERDQTYRLVFAESQSKPEVIPMDYRDVSRDIRDGQRVLMDDGLLRFSVEKIEGSEVLLRSHEDGVLKSRKGINFPDSKLSLPALTEKDTRDLIFGISHHVDYVALSFVQSPDDVTHLKAMIQSLGADVPVVSKIEKLSALDDIDEVARVSDGLMVARGDLGVESNLERVPALQRKIVEAAERYGRPVIVATQMLESMIQNPRATIAEVADVANGVLDGADCLMLSAEVANGKYPVECVRKMASIIRQVEAWTFKKPMRYALDQDNDYGRSWEEHEAIARGACEAADALSAKAIVCLTLTGSIARLIARWRPTTPIFAISPRKDVTHRLSIVWGVYGVQNPLFYNTDILLQDLPEMLKKMRVAESGDAVVITAGIPINQVRPTNMIKINYIP